MRKTFITFISFLYLVSSIILGSSQHYCSNGQQMRITGESQCCVPEAPTESSPVQQAPAHSCCDQTGIPGIAGEFDTSSPGDCCEIRHIYNLLEGPSLIIPVDPGISANIDAKHFYYPQPPQRNDESVPIIQADPLFRLNLPLLI